MKEKYEIGGLIFGLSISDNNTVELSVDGEVQEELDHENLREAEQTYFLVQKVFHLIVDFV
jgi:hypothetical protein